MKPLYPIVICLTLLFTYSQSCLAQRYLDMIAEGQHTVKDIQLEANAYFSEEGTGRGTGYKRWKRWEYDAIRMQDDDGYYHEAQDYFKNLADYHRFLIDQYQERSSMCMGDWTSLGPKEVNGAFNFDPGLGRLTSIAIDPSNTDHMIVGAETGGVWRSEDGGATWLPISDFLVTLRVHGLAIDPLDSDIYYWGATGAIYRSLDRGNSWEELDFGGWGDVNVFKINPQDNSEIWAGGYTGVYHTTDGGLTWEKLADDRIYDMEFHPTDPTTIYASGDDIWRSTDSGKSFEALQVHFQNNTPLLMSVSADAPDRLYVLQMENKGFKALYISEDQGNTYLEMDQQGKNLLGYNLSGGGGGGQAPRNMDIIVADDDKNEIFIAGINLWRSLNGGVDFHPFSYFGYQTGIPDVAYIHADIEVLEYADGALLVGSDGGLYKLPDPAVATIDHSAVEDISNGLDIRQIYRIGLSQADTLFATVGAQDNGAARLLDGEWYYYGGGDGTETFIVDNAERTIFASSQYGTLKVSHDKGQSSQPLPGTYQLQGSGLWVTPFEKDPIDTNTIYAGYDVVYRSTDLGETFDTISQLIYPHHIKVAPRGNDTIYASSAHKLYRTTDGGQSPWEVVIQPFQNFKDINYIAVHPRNANVVAIAVAGAKRVLVTHDGGVEWEEWNEGLPVFQALTLVWDDSDEEALYLGMDVGVYYADKANPTWVPFNLGLPNVKVNELEIHHKTQTIFAGTYGRGLWMSPLCGKEVTSTEDVLADYAVVILPNPILADQGCTIRSGLSEEVEVQVFNQQGIIVHRKPKVSLQSSYTFSTDHLRPGIYFVQIRNSSSVLVKKLIVQ